MSEISMDKKYKTRHGMTARVVCVDAKGNQPVIALVFDSHSSKEFVIRTSIKGEFFDGDVHELDLIEVSPYDDFNIDDPVMVRRDDDLVRVWKRRYFAGVNGCGEPLTWYEGMTSWSSGGHKTCWDECRRPTPEELAK
jgi:hypothetical protein